MELDIKLKDGKIVKKISRYFKFRKIIFFKSQENFAKKSPYPISLKNYVKAITICCNSLESRTALEIQNYKINLEAELLMSAQKTLLEKRFQKFYLKARKLLIYLYQIIFQKKIYLYKFQNKNKQNQIEIGTFNYGAQNTGFYGFYPEPECLKLICVEVNITLRHRILLLKNILSGVGTTFYHDVQNAELWSSYNGTKFVRFFVVEGNDYVTKVLIDIMKFHGSEIVIVQYAPYLGLPQPNSCLNLVNNEKMYKLHKFLNNRVEMHEFPYCIVPPMEMRSGKGYISFFATAPHVTITEAIIIKDISGVMGVVETLNTPLKMSLHPQWRKNSTRINLTSCCNFRDYAGPFEDFLLSSEVVISHWSTVIVQAAYAGKKVIMLDFRKDNLIDLLSDEIVARVKVAYSEQHLLELLKIALERDATVTRGYITPPPINLLNFQP